MVLGRFIALFSGVMVLWSGVYLYLGVRLIAPSGLEKPLRRIAWLVLAAATFAGPVVLFSARLVSKPTWYPMVTAVGFSAMGFILLVLPMVLVKDAVALLVAAAAKVRSRPKDEIDPARRRLRANAFSIGVLVLGASLWGFGYATARKQPPEIVRVDVFIDELPFAFDGFTIAQLSDLHLGSTIAGREQVRAIVGAVNAERPDVVAITGDLADGYASELGADAAPLGELVAEWKLFVTGNHEYYWDPRGWIDLVARLGFTVLTNEHRVIERGGAPLVLAGVPDPSAADTIPEHASRPQAALRRAPAGATKILLAHQPSIHAAAESAGFDLQLSGHTHGGQFWPWTWLVRLAQPFDAGLFRSGRMWIYVNRGTGTWGPPLRTGRSGEITLLVLRRAP